MGKPHSARPHRSDSIDEHTGSVGSSTVPSAASGLEMDRSTSNAMLIPGDESMTIDLEVPIHTKEEYGVPMFLEVEEEVLDNLIQGIFDEGGVDVDSLLADICRGVIS